MSDITNGRSDGASDQGSRPSISFVTPRYGADIIGGAEHAARMLAERLVQRGWQVEALTTVAGDIQRWAPGYPEGETIESGVVVKRFKVDKGRDPRFQLLTRPTEFYATSATENEAADYLELQGPVSGELVEAIRESDSDHVAFYPYLYHPAVYGAKTVTDRVVLHPAAHDEAPLYLPVFKELFETAPRIVFHTAAEERLVRSVFRISQTRRITLGLGIDPAPENAPDNGAEILGFDPAQPYICAVGRVDTLKGTTMLADFVASYRERHSVKPNLALVGTVAVAPDEKPWLKITGPVSEEEKWAIIKGSSALISPSYYESFSLVMMEAWSVAKPVMVNSRCEPTRDHIERSGAGVHFGDYPQFEVGLELILEQPVAASKLGSLGQQYVTDNYSWQVVMDRYTNFLH